MIGAKQLYSKMIQYRSPFVKTCATIGAFSGFFAVNSYYLRKNCNHFIDHFEKGIDIDGQVIINDKGINIGDKIKIDDNSITIGNGKQIQTGNGRIARFKLRALDYLMINGAPYTVNFLIGTVTGSAIGYVYGMYFPITIPLTLGYAIVSNIVNNEL